MPSFNELYGRLVKSSAEGKTEEELKKIRKEDYDEHQIDCLLNPDKHPLVWRVGECNCSEKSKETCVSRCLFDALKVDENGNIEIIEDKCVGCSECIDKCKAEKLVASKDIVPVLGALKKAESPIYAIIAPAFISQFSDKTTPGKLRSAFKAIGFTGMVEVALFADILTLKEALEFDKTILTDEDFLLTSCCCPMWIGMIRRVYHQLVPHVPGAVSPMVACGRTIKQLDKGAKVVFIGPCIAKKAEAKEKDIADAVDYVLTFQEIKDIFDFVGINPEAMEDDDRDHSSRAGRIYARAGGVSEAVKNTVKRLNPDRKITVHARQASGVKACKEMLNDLKEGKNTANFLEGMGCVGGCVGGPRVLIDKEEGKAHVNAYGDEAVYSTPVDNPYVIELLQRLGFDTVEKLLEESDIFTRKF